MKILSVMWSVVLLELRTYHEFKPNQDIYEIVKAAKLEKYEYLKEENPFTDTIWEISDDLKEIDLEYNQNLKRLFFQHWKNVEYENKLRIFKNLDMPENEKFNPEIKKYLAKNIIEYPCIMELHKFRKELNQESLKKALKNIYSQINFNRLKNQRKEDYWTNHISGKEEDKLLELLELSGLKKEELIDFNKIGFLNEVRQAKFDKINNQESNLPLLINNDSQVYLLVTEINGLNLLKEENKLGTKFINSATQYISSLIKNVMKSENMEPIVMNNNNVLKFITPDKEVYEEALLKRKSLTRWLEDNKSVLIEKVRNFNKENKTLLELEDETKELADKIILKNKLENKLVEKSGKNMGIKKI